MEKPDLNDIQRFVSGPLFDEKVILSKDPSLPRISIVTPSYNQARFLERTILSVLNQGYPNTEYIIIDGGSTDGSVEIIKKYEKYLAYWVSEKDHGQADAVNKGFLKSTGEILTWQNSDDLFLPNAFFSAVEAFKRYPQSSLVFGNVKMVDEEDQECGELRFVPFRRWALMHGRMMMGNQAAFWRRELFFDAGLLDASLNFVMDYEFFLRASFCGKFKFIREFQGALRLQGESKTSTIPQVRIREYAEVQRKLNLTGSQAWKIMSIGQRIFWHLAQGELDYVTREVLRRWRRV